MTNGEGVEVETQIVVNFTLTVAANEAAFLP